MKKKLRDTRFGSPYFEGLSYELKVQLIHDFEDELECLSSEALYYIGTIIIRSSCGCKLIDVIYLEDRGSTIDVALQHEPTCLSQRFPTEEDYSDSTIRKRQRREIILDNSRWVHLEEFSCSADVNKHYKRQPK